LLLEADLQKSYTKGEPVETIYLGGGTPSVLDPDQLNQIIHKLQSLWHISQTAEITAEVNPDDLSLPYLKEIKEAGFNRLSIGIQSFHNPLLRYMNRRHNAGQAFRSVSMAREAGFSNISIDLIYGLPGLTTEIWKETLQQAIQTGADHVSAYHLTLEPSTVFGKRKRENRLSETEEEESVRQYNLLRIMLQEAGYLHYEISNFARQGFFSAHNTGYWNQSVYLGLGPSAHSFNRVTRQWNVSDLQRYMRQLQNGIIPAEKEDLSPKTQFNEYLMTNLRTAWGMDLEYAKNHFSHDLITQFGKVYPKYLHKGLSLQENRFLKITPEYWFTSDSLLSSLFIL
jgi:oxygen-independent coproporphyrinogen-3 oxidase